MNAINNPEIQHASKQEDIVSPEEASSGLKKSSTGSKAAKMTRHVNNTNPPAAADSACKATDIHDVVDSLDSLTAMDPLFAEIYEKYISRLRKQNRLTSIEISAKDTRKIQQKNNGGSMTGRSGIKEEDGPPLLQDDARFSALLITHMQTIDLSQEQEKKLADLTEAINEIARQGLIESALPDMHPAVDTLLDEADLEVRLAYLKNAANQKINY